MNPHESRTTWPIRWATGFLLAVLVPGAARGAPEESAAPWAPWTVVEGPQEALVDCRSLTIAHEQRVALGKEFAVGGAGLTFGLAPDGKITVSERAGKSTTWSKPRTLAAPPLLVPVTAFGLKYAVAVRRAREEGEVWVSSAFGGRVRLGKDDAYVVDSDRDGVLGSAGDGLVAAESRTVGPYEGPVWTLLAAVEVRKGASGAWEGRAIPMPYPGKKDHEAAWRLLQWRRQQCGLLALAYDASMEAGVVAHANYCVENDYRGHDQEPGKPFYSEEGAAGGKESVLGYEVKNLYEGMLQQLSTLYHRNGLLQPALTHTGMALHRGVFGANVRRKASGRLKDHLCLFPPHGMTNAAREFSPAGEHPMPAEGQITFLQSLGTPISLYAGSMEQTPSMAEKPTLRVTQLVGSHREVGKIYRRNVIYPGNPPKTGVPASNFGAVAIMPSEYLEPKTTYLCELHVRLPPSVKTPFPHPDPWDLDWEFTTSK